MAASFEKKTCPECKGEGTLLARTKSGVARLSKHKGDRNELKVAKMIAVAIDVPYEECRRTPNSGALIERGDLRLSAKAIERFPWFIEVKAREAWDFWQVFSVKDADNWEPFAWFHDAQLKARHDARTGFSGGKVLPVLLILCQNRKPPLVMLDNADRQYPGMSGPFIKISGFTVFRFDALLDVFRYKSEGVAQNA